MLIYALTYGICIWLMLYTDHRVPDPGGAAGSLLPCTVSRLVTTLAKPALPPPLPPEMVGGATLWRRRRAREDDGAEEELPVAAVLDLLGDICCGDAAADEDSVRSG